MRYTKDPEANLDYKIDWAGDDPGPYLADGETIVSSTWAATGLTSTSPTHDDTTTTVWLAGGTVDTYYTVTNHITTSGGRTDERSFSIHVKER